MNIGEKIKSLREAKNLSIEDLANLINDTASNIEKYENNEIEPALDKKLALAQALDVSLSDLSYNIEDKRNFREENEIEENDKASLEENHIEEEPIEKNLTDDEEVLPLAVGAISYNEEIFNKTFKKDYNRYFIQSAISFIAYIVLGFFTINAQFTLLTYLCFGLSAFSVIKLIMNIVRYRSTKKNWLAQYGGLKKIYQFYENCVDVVNDEVTITNEDSEKNSLDTNPYIEDLGFQENKHKEFVLRFNYKDFRRIIEKDGLIVCITNMELKTIITIDKSKMSEKDLQIVKDLLHRNCPNYVDIDTQNANRGLATKTNQILNKILWAIVIINIISILFSSFIFSLFKLDRTLINGFLPYLVMLPIALISIIAWLVAKIKFKFNSKKNLITGIIVCVISLLLIGYSGLNYQTAKKNNNDEFVQKIESYLNVDLPNDYFTDFYQNYDDEFSFNEIVYELNEFYFLSFAKKDEINKFKETFNPLLATWQTSDQEINQILTTIFKQIKVNLTSPNKFALYDVDEQKFVENLTSTADASPHNYDLFAYYESEDILIVITFNQKIGN